MKTASVSYVKETCLQLTTGIGASHCGRSLYVFAYVFSPFPPLLCWLHESRNHVDFVLAINQANQFYQMKGSSFSTMSDTLDFAALRAQSLSPHHPASLVEVDLETFYFQLQGTMIIHFLRIQSPEN